MKRWFNKALLVLVLLHAHIVLADPFDKVEEKGNELIDFLTGSFGVLVIALALCISGVGLMFNMLSKSWAVRILGGGILIGSCVTIAEWIV